MAQVYLEEFFIEETQSTGKRQAHVDFNGGLVLFDDRNDALNLAKLLFSNGNYFILQRMAILNTAEYDLSGAPPPGSPLTKIALFDLEYNTRYMNYRARSISGIGNFSLTFIIPNDFNNLISLDLLFIPSSGAAGTGKDIDLNSDYGGEGESIATHQESDVTSTYDLGTENYHESIDISSVFSSLSAGDRCSVNVDNNSIGGSTYLLAIALKYEAV